MKKWKKYYCVVLALVIAIVLFGCGNNEKPAATTPSPNSSPNSQQSPNPDTPSSPAVSGNSDEFVTIKIGVSNYLGRFLTGLSPADNASACDALFDLVFKINPKTKEIYSDILEEWHWEDDALLVMTLKDGIYFSNGDEATSEDLLFAFMQHLERGSQFVRNMLLVPEKCMIRDDYTVQLQMERKDEAIFTTAMYLYNKKWADQVGWDSEDWYKPVGSGPYECVEYVYDDHMVLRLRDDYWARNIEDFYVDEYIITYYPESSVLFMALENGDVDTCAVDSTDYSRYLKNGGNGYDVALISNGVSINVLLGYQEFPGWTDKALRQAVLYGVNWDELGQMIMGDLYVPASTITPASGPLYHNVGQYEFNPEKAKELLAEAGYAPGELTLTTFLSDTSFYKTFGEGVTYYLDKIGINTDITYGDTSSTLEKWNTPGAGSMFAIHYNIRGSITTNPTTSISLTPVKQGIQFGYVEDDHFQELFQKLSTSFDNPDMNYRKQAARDLMQYIYDETLVIPFMESVSTMGYRNGLLSEQQIHDYFLTTVHIQLSTLGLKSAWGK